MNILLLSAYDAPSHRYWREGLAAHLGEFRFTQVCLPARHFSWRIRGNPLSWINTPELHGDYDALIATSMVDLACLRGLLPQLSKIPSLYYFHENQFAYPITVNSHKSVEPQMVTLYGALAADKLAFNSDYNRQTFLDGVRQLLNALPDCVPANVTEKLAAKSCVLPVPISDCAPPQTLVTRNVNTNNPFTIIWNHRWEYDKGPAKLLAIIENLPAQLPLRWHIVGQQFRSIPPEFAAIQQVLTQRGWQGHWGFVAERASYNELLATSDCVLSTALHDFQGLAILEAVAAGCVPVVPNRLAYPEWFAADYCYASHADAETEARAAAQMIMQLCAGAQSLNVPNVQQFYWRNLRDDYKHLVQNLAQKNCME